MTGWGRAGSHLKPRSFSTNPGGSATPGRNFLVGGALDRGCLLGGTAPGRRGGQHCQHREGKGGDAVTRMSVDRADTGKKVMVPTPQQWAEEQLKNAPQRSQEWARRVAQIYGLDVDDTSTAG